MKINCYFETGQTDHGVICALQQTVKNLINKYPEIEFEIVDNQIKKQQGNYPNPFSKYGAYYLIIENPATHKYILVSYGDKLVDIARTEWDLENCVEIFSSIGYHENDVEYKKQTVIKATPISYVGGSAQNEKMLRELYLKRMESGSPRIYPQKPAFRGQLYLFRRHLFDDERFEIKGEFYKLNEKGEVVPGETSRLPPKEYLEELDSRALNLSLNGTGEICFRDMEILGLGTALFRPKLVTELRNKLIPDYHYISVDFEDISQGGTGFQVYCDKLANRMIERFNQIKDDREFIDFIAKNGRKWYEENATIEMNAKIASNAIDLSKITI